LTQKIATQRNLVTKQHTKPNHIAHRFAMLLQSLVRGGGDQKQ
jgi:hypothetical protein